MGRELLPGMQRYFHIGHRRKAFGGTQLAVCRGKQPAWQ